MTFWILAGVLVVLAIAWLAPSLLKTRKLSDLDRKQQNITIARERLDELAAENAAGEMTDVVYEQVKGELEASLIDDVDETADAEVVAGQGKVGLFTWAILGLCLLAGTLSLYQQLGSPQYIQYAGAGAGRTESAQHLASSAQSVDELIEKLKQRLEKSPEDGEGWFLLARSYMAQDKFQPALDALNKAYEIIGDHPQILLGIADASAMLKDGDLTGRPSELIDKALGLEPDNTTALWLGGMAAQQNGNFQQAIDRWSALVPSLAEDAQSQQRVKALIQEAARQAEQAGISVKAPQFAAPVSKSIAVTVNVDPSITAAVSADTAVFVFARAAEGPPVPLAAFKTTVADLPMSITLDDARAMIPNFKLSDFDEVIVSARIAMSGNPVASAGDFSSDQVQMKLIDSAQLELNISHRVEDPKNIPLIQHSTSTATQNVTPPLAENVEIKAWVSISDTMKQQASADDVVFVFARPASGPRMPLAVFQTRVAELPMEVTLNDDMAMMPQAKLSAFKLVSVSARVSKSGKAMPASGDLSSEAVTVEMDGKTGVQLTIDRTIP